MSAAEPTTTIETPAPTEPVQTTMLETPAPDGSIDPENWRDSLPADMRDNEVVKRYKTLTKFAESAINARAKLSQTCIRKPGKDATLQDVAEYYTELGRPSDVDTYKFDDIDYGIAPKNEDSDSRIMKEMYDAGLNEYQARRLMEFGVKEAQFQVQAQLDQQEQNVTDLDAKLNAEFGAAKAIKLELAARGWEKLFGEGDTAKEKAHEIANLKLVDGTMLGDHFDLIRAMADLGQHVGEDGQIGPKQTRFAKTPQEAKQDIATLAADPEFQEALHNRRHVGHAEAVRRQTAAYEAVYGGQ